MIFLRASQSSPINHHQNRIHCHGSGGFGLDPMRQKYQRLALPQRHTFWCVAWMGVAVFTVAGMWTIWP